MAPRAGGRRTESAEPQALYDLGKKGRYVLFAVEAHQAGLPVATMDDTRLRY